MLEGNRRIRTITRRSSILQSGGDRRALGRQNKLSGQAPNSFRANGACPGLLKNWGCECFADAMFGLKPQQSATDWPADGLDRSVKHSSSTVPSPGLRQSN